MGGVEPIARIVLDLSPATEDAEMEAALGALDQTAVAQRLGFILEVLNQRRLAGCVFKWLTERGRMVGRQPFELGTSRADQTAFNRNWHICFDQSHTSALEELR